VLCPNIKIIKSKRMRCTVMCGREMNTKFQYENLNEKDTYEGRGVDGQFMELVTGCNLPFIQDSDFLSTHICCGQKNHLLAMFLY
jgi:hypothetical protein